MASNSGSTTSPSGGPHSVRLDWDPPAGGGTVTSYEVTRLRAPYRTNSLTIIDPDSGARVSSTAFVDSDVRRKSQSPDVLGQITGIPALTEPRPHAGCDGSLDSRHPPVIPQARALRVVGPSPNRGRRQRSRQRPAHFPAELGDRGRSLGKPPTERLRRDRHASAWDIRADLGAVPGAPQNLRATHDSAGDRIIVSWSPPADGGGDRITSYQVGRSRADASSPARWSRFPVLRRPQSTTFNLDGITAGVFRYWVRAVNSAGFGPWTSVDFRL